MKNQWFVRFMFLLGGISFLALAPSLHAAESGATAEIISMEGSVQVLSPPATEWAGAEKGMALAQGDQVLTGPKSTCELALGDGEKSVIRLTPDSKTTLTSIDPVKIDLQSGKLFALVRGLKKGSAFQVSTPTAVASARGTGFSQDFHSVEVFEDSVDVEGAAGVDPTVSEGNGISVNDDGTLGDTYPLSQDSVDEWNEFKEDAEDNTGEGDEDASEDSDGGLSSPGGDETDEDLKDESKETEDEEDIDEELTPEETPGDKGQYEVFSGGQ